MDEWKAQGGTTSEPQDPRRHDLTDSVFIPGLRSFAPAEVIPAAGRADDAMVIWGDDIRLGDASATDYVALAQPTEDNFTALKDAIVAAPVVAGDGGASFKAALISALSLWPSATGATQVKAV
jgi:hypothetical protein